MPSATPTPDVFREEDYFPSMGVPEFWSPGEYGPLDCGCYLVALEFDPHGPCLCVVMSRRDKPDHTHTLDDFKEIA